MEKVQNVIQVSPVVGGYRIAGNICGTSVTLLLDTGAAVTLLWHDVWMSIADRTPHLQPWHGATLVSAGGESFNCPWVHQSCIGAGGKDDRS